MTGTRPHIINQQAALVTAVAEFGDYAWCWRENDLTRVWCVIGILNGLILIEYGRGENWNAAMVEAEAGYRRLTQ